MSEESKRKTANDFYDMIFDQGYNQALEDFYNHYCDIVPNGGMSFTKTIMKRVMQDLWKG